MALEKTNTIHTRKEIEGQPDLWMETFEQTINDKRIKDFLKPLYKKEKLNVVLTGAGSSSFIGETVETYFRFMPGVNARAISTTTLVTHFKSLIDCETPLLLISFGRSGNSPESNAVVDIAERFSKEVHHIAITCNAKGKLAQTVNHLNNGLTIILPPESEDKGLAMTGSFTSMILTALYIANSENSDGHAEIIKNISSNAKKVINRCSAEFKNLSFKAFDRIVFLGSGPLQGIAKESHLKVQELTDGVVVGKFDSFLGFRHGPKAVVNNKTVVVFLFSTDEKVFRYEKDLVNEILQDGIAMHSIGVFCDEKQAIDMDLDQKIIFDLDNSSKGSACNSVLYVLPAQLLGYYKSLDLGLDPDAPSHNNVINRVVKGVKIYN
ncbi:MAG: SIS domain-containing protein [Balneolaceae bacterium]|nr:SIS domain-containing protein [Balneolaceae bacterium]MDR9408282.1 SIS domain-containing protein [Balneolaceae bacterium]